MADFLVSVANYFVLLQNVVVSAKYVDLIADLTLVQYKTSAQFSIIFEKEISPELFITTELTDVIKAAWLEAQIPGK